MKIVSLLPSATEIVCALGLEAELVGVTHECDYPPSVAGLPRVTRTLIPTDASSAEIDGLVREQLSSGAALYSLDMDVLERLAPDVIVTQALCDVCAVPARTVNEAVASLEPRPKMISLDPTGLEDILTDIERVGRAVDREEEASRVVAGLRARMKAVGIRLSSLATGRSSTSGRWM